MVDTLYFAEILIVTAQTFRYILKTLKILALLEKIIPTPLLGSVSYLCSPFLANNEHAAGAYQLVLTANFCLFSEFYNDHAAIRSAPIIR